MNRTRSQADAAAALVEQLQHAICGAVSALEPDAVFTIDNWQSPGATATVGGRGSTRVMAGGSVIEKGGVNTSIVTGAHLPPSVIAQRPELQGCGFFAAGVSVVIHPRNPLVPTSHCNFRYFEARRGDGSAATSWLGGGADLTPYYPQLEDVRHFHGALRDACAAHDPSYYPAFKAWCDRYFYLKHRGETRGVGGIFYDYLDERGYGESSERASFAVAKTFDELLAFMHDAGYAYIEGYAPIVQRHMHEPYTEDERNFQLLRRGRYVEFNLLYDRGTLFGLQSGGRTESILMSLPSLVRWAYDERPAAGSREAELGRYLQPRDWFAQDPFAS
jgi:coproporphyrinogen III oxidase